jgi:hypothetical protein
MKKLFLFFFIIFITQYADAQSGIFFQAIARDINTNPAKDRKIYVQSNIIQSAPSGTIVLIEEHQTNTDSYGVFSIMVGNGTRVGGTVGGISTIDWSKGPYYLNLKIAITPVGVGAGWDYSKEWVDIGTTIFGTVPFALYSASTAKIDDKLNSSDTSKMLEPYAKGKAVQVLSTSIDTKLATKDTAAMLAPYAKLSNNLDINYLKNQIASLLNASDTVKYTKQSYTDSALLKKMNVFDTIIYAKQLFVDSALLTKLTTTGSAAGLTNFPILNQNTTGNAATAIYAGNITATSNTTLTSLSNLNTVGTITSGVWSATTIDVAHGGTGLTTAGLSGDVLSTASDGSLTWVSLTSSTTTHRIGERFGGGIVFYVYDNGKHGLIAATTDQATFVRWGNTTAVNAVRDGINAGMANTERIILVQGSAGDYAAQIAANYQGGGFGDWYLPSKYELNLLFQKKAFVGLFPGFTYWSSNESGNNNAWGQDFNDIWGTQFYTNRTQKHSCVRAIRSF